MDSFFPRQLKPFLIYLRAMIIIPVRSTARRINLISKIHGRTGLVYPVYVHTQPISSQITSPTQTEKNPSAICSRRRRKEAGYPKVSDSRIKRIPQTTIIPSVFTTSWVCTQVNVCVCGKIVFLAAASGWFRLNGTRNQWDYSRFSE